MNKLAMVKTAEVSGVVAALVDTGEVKLASEQDFNTVVETISTSLDDQYTLDDVLAKTAEVMETAYAIYKVAGLMELSEEEAEELAALALQEEAEAEAAAAEAAEAQAAAEAAEGAAGGEELTPEEIAILEEAMPKMAGLVKRAQDAGELTEAEAQSLLSSYMVPAGAVAGGALGGGAGYFGGVKGQGAAQRAKDLLASKLPGYTDAVPFSGAAAKLRQVNFAAQNPERFASLVAKLQGYSAPEGADMARRAAGGAATRAAGAVGAVGRGINAVPNAGRAVLNAGAGAASTVLDRSGVQVSKGLKALGNYLSTVDSGKWARRGGAAAGAGAGLAAGGLLAKYLANRE